MSDPKSPSEDRLLELPVLGALEAPAGESPVEAPEKIRARLSRTMLRTLSLIHI